MLFLLWYIQTKPESEARPFTADCMHCFPLRQAVCAGREGIPGIAPVGAVSGGLPNCNKIAANLLTFCWKYGKLIPKIDSIGIY